MKPFIRHIITFQKNHSFIYLRFDIIDFFCVLNHFDEGERCLKE